jgi:hypothetical protein
MKGQGTVSYGQPFSPYVAITPYSINSGVSSMRLEAYVSLFNFVIP